MTRSRTSQTKHDRAVQTEATRLKNQDYKVKADVKGFPRPDTVRGYRPDVVATKGRERKIIEVETPDSVDSARDRGQQAAFRQAAKQSKNTSFRTKLTK